MHRNLLIVSAFAVPILFAGSLRADEIPDNVQKAIDGGLDFLDRTQHRDGHWDANGGQYPAAMTALGGMCLLMEGSTLREGKYSQNIRRAVDWFMERVQPNGLLGNPANPTEAGRYMYGHGFGMLFLACAYGEEEDADRRKRLEKILTKAVEFAGKAQTDRGGWGYVSAQDGSNFDEGSVTVTQLQGIRAAKNAGIVVPKSIIDKAVDYLGKCTTERGGVIYSLAQGGMAVNGAERPAHRRGHRLFVQRRAVRRQTRQEMAAVLPRPYRHRRPPPGTRRIPAVLLWPGDVHPRRQRLGQTVSRPERQQHSSGLEQVSQEHVRCDPEKPGGRRQLERRLHRPTLRHLHQSDPLATR